MKFIHFYELDYTYITLLTIVQYYYIFLYYLGYFIRLIKIKVVKYEKQK